MSDHEENLQDDIEMLESQIDARDETIKTMRAALLEAYEYMDAVLPDEDERLILVRDAVYPQGVPEEEEEDDGE